MAGTGTGTGPSPNTASKKPQPLPWTHEETLHLIQAYQEKWYSLKRGQLKSSQWEEVAVTVAARCGYDHTEPSSKSALQCRHKMEKLRQRLRSEKQRLPTPSSSSSWPYFHHMDSLDRGPLPPISALPISLVPPPHNESDYDDDDDDNDAKEEGGFDEEDYDCHGRSRSIDYILRRPTIVNRFAAIGGDGDATGKRGCVSGIFGEPVAKRRREELVGNDDDPEEDEEEEEEGRGLVSELAAEIRAFAGRFIGMENMKMKMMKDSERFRMEMENKRMELILESQQRIVDSIERTFGSP
ncbi:hypothetical protein I3843_04G096900 [Carya illinoinensis]|nr:hypothetical protein I3843_04G096900 [Carya illinoinensis]